MNRPGEFIYGHARVVGRRYQWQGVYDCRTEDNEQRFFQIVRRRSRAALKGRKHFRPVKRFRYASERDRQRALRRALSFARRGGRFRPGVLAS